MMRPPAPRSHRITEPVASRGAGRNTLLALLFGNFVVGAGVLAPAGLVNELSRAFAVDVPRVGTLIAYGAITLCIGAPLLAFVTNRMERRLLLVLALGVYAAGHVVSLWAPDFRTLLLVRVVMIVAAAVYTPQAASAVSQLVAPERRAAAVAFIFMGWPLAFAIGVPAASLLGASWGWQAAFAALGVAATIALLAVGGTLPRNVRVPPLSLQDWRDTFANPSIMLILGVTALAATGQLTLYPFVAAELRQRFATGPGAIATLLALHGSASVVGALVSTSLITRLRAPRTASLSLAGIVLGLLVWHLAGSSLAWAALGLAAWGTGFGPSVSAQQARLIGAQPRLASASVALNTSFLYLGQGIGAALGGGLLRHGYGDELGLVAAALAAVALAASLWISRHLQA